MSLTWTTDSNGQVRSILPPELKREVKEQWQEKGTGTLTGMSCEYMWWMFQQKVLGGALKRVEDIDVKAIAESKFQHILQYASDMDAFAGWLDQQQQFEAARYHRLLAQRCKEYHLNSEKTWHSQETPSQDTYPNAEASSPVSSTPDQALPPVYSLAQ